MRDYTQAIRLNNNYADGTDVSWIWDGHYEQIVDFPIEKVVTSGMKADEMTKRLTVAGIKPELINQVENNEQIIEAIKAAPTEYVHILATYTAMLDLREAFIQKGYIQSNKGA